jgi:hypothetical protein
MEDKKRIGIGNSRFPGLNEDIKITPDPDITFSSTSVMFDSLKETFDQEN